MLLIHRLALESSLFQRAALRAQPAAGVGAVDRTAAAGRPARPAWRRGIAPRFAVEGGISQPNRV